MSRHLSLLNQLPEAWRRSVVNVWGGVHLLDPKTDNGWQAATGQGVFELRCSSCNHLFTSMPALKIDACPNTPCQAKRKDFTFKPKQEINTKEPLPLLQSLGSSAAHLYRHWVTIMKQDERSLSIC